jgi:two-component system chemotaxis sensor kinase CheA
LRKDNINDPMLEMFVFETLQLMEQLELSILKSENEGFTSFIDEIFRIMHTLKGSASMMSFNNIAMLAHSVEDLFFYIREERPANINYTEVIDIVLESIDYIKAEISKIQDGGEPDGDPASIIECFKNCLAENKRKNETPLENVKNNKGNEKNSHIEDNSKKKKQKKGKNAKEIKETESKDKKQTTLDGTTKYQAVVFFEDGCEMENIRAYSIIHNLTPMATEISYYPKDIMDNTQSAEVIRKQGFKIIFRSNETLEGIKEFFESVIFLKHLELDIIKDQKTAKDQALNKSLKGDGKESQANKTENNSASVTNSGGSTIKQSMISVNIARLDKLMDLIGELVICEAMVIKNPELAGLELTSFHKAASQLQKITNELQDIVMAIRMVPLSVTFHNLNRVIRDMTRKLGKEIIFEVKGEETEVDKNIIEHITDPLIHLVRNAIDHGIEPVQERLEKGKHKAGKIIVEAQNVGGDVLITVKDDGRGLDRSKILKKAYENGVIDDLSVEYSDREVYAMILAPGFSTSETVTEFSGRGVGMDIVNKNIKKVGGIVTIDSVPGQGTTIFIKIPLTLAIIEGMVVTIGRSSYIIPMMSIRESFRADSRDIIKSPEGNEMILVRGNCYPILRLHKYYNIKTDVVNITDGILVMIESDSKIVCVLVDSLLGEQQVVVKALPSYIKKVRGVSGCTLLGDGSISLIIDVADLIKNEKRSEPYDRVS